MLPWQHVLWRCKVHLAKGNLTISNLHETGYRFSHTVSHMKVLITVWFMYLFGLILGKKIFLAGFTNFQSTVPKIQLMYFYIHLFVNHISIYLRIKESYCLPRNAPILCSLQNYTFYKHAWLWHVFIVPPLFLFFFSFNWNLAYIPIMWAYIYTELFLWVRIGCNLLVLNYHHGLVKVSVGWLIAP